MTTDDAFEKWPLDFKRKFINQFKEAYNEGENTHYDLTKETFIDNQDYDFILQQRDGKILKVQHFFAAADQKREYIKPKQVNEVINALRDRLKDLKDLFVHIDISNPPADKKDQEKLVFWLELLIRDKAKRLTDSLFTYDRHDDEYLKEIRDQINLLVIKRMKGLERIVFAFGSLSIGPLLRGDERVGIALRSKENRYASPEDIVAVLHFNKMPFSDFFLIEVQDLEQSSKFKGIWIYDPWREEGRFIRIK